METTPFFSVITPVYNTEKYLPECIESVVRQSFESWELILVDDGSTDRSGEICDDYSKDPRIRVVHQSNQGELRSRYNGLQLAKGKYEIGLDSDDYLAENCLQRIKEAIDISGCDLIMYSIVLFGAQEGVLHGGLASKRQYDRDEILREVIGNTNHSLCNKAIKTEIARTADYSELDPMIRFDLDCAQIVPVICRIGSGYVIEDELYYYRIHQNSISQATKVSHILDTGTVTAFVLKEIEKQNIDDRYIHEMVYVSYLKTISLRIMNLFISKQITKEDCRMIHKDVVYRDSKEYEKYCGFRFYPYVILKLFRHGMYLVLKMLACGYRIKTGTGI